MQQNSHSPLIVSEEDERHVALDRRPPRLVGPDGKRLICRKGVSLLRLLRISNAYNTLVNLSLVQQITLVSATLMGSWSFFAVLWLLENYFNQDKECLTNINSFLGALLFSIETQTTIGFGYRKPKEACYTTVLILWLQMIVGLLLDSAMLAIVISKISHAHFRENTIQFSDIVCVSKREDQYILSVRIADVSKGVMPEGHARLYLVYSAESPENPQSTSLVFEDLDIGYDKGKDRLILLVPWIVEHVISEESPLFDLTPETSSFCHFEILAVLEGNVQETGCSVQVVKSYTLEDVRWGYRFKDMLVRDGGNRYFTDFSRLNSVLPDQDMPACSARHFLSTTSPSHVKDDGKKKKKKKTKSVRFEDSTSDSNS